MRGTLVVTGEPGGEVPKPPELRAGAADPGGADRPQHQDPHAAGEGRDHASRPEDPDVDLRRHVPRADDQAAHGIPDLGHLRPRPAEECGVADRAPARRTPELRRRRATHPPAHPQGNPSDLHLPARREREADAGELPLLPRPPDGPDRAQQLAWPPGHVPGDRRARGEARPPERPVRRAVALLRPQLHRPQPADRPLPQHQHARVDDRSSGTARRRHGRQADPGQRPVRAVPAGQARPLPAPSPERLPLLGL